MEYCSRITFNVLDYKLFENFVGVKVNTLLGNASDQVGPETLIKAVDSLFPEHPAHNLKSIVVFSIVSIVKILVLLDSRPYCCDGIGHHHAPSFAYAPANEILLLQPRLGKISIVIEDF